MTRFLFKGREHINEKLEKFKQSFKETHRRVFNKNHPLNLPSFLKFIFSLGNILSKIFQIISLYFFLFVPSLRYTYTLRSFYEGGHITYTIRYVLSWITIHSRTSSEHLRHSVPLLVLCVHCLFKFIAC